MKISELGSGVDAFRRGSALYEWKGVPCPKSPIAVALTQLLLWREQPRTIVEVGTQSGGNTLLLASLSRALEIECRVISLDAEAFESFVDERIEFRRAGFRSIGDVLSPSEMMSLPRPMLFVANGALEEQDAKAVLEFFSEWARVGECICVEGSLPAVSAFLAAEGSGYTEAIEYDAFYGGDDDIAGVRYLRKTGATPSREHRYGNEDAVITSVAIQDAFGQSVRMLQPLNSYVIEVGVQSRQPDLEITLGILVRTVVGMEVFGADSLQRPEPQVLTLGTGECAIAKAQFRNVLAPGRYWLTVSLAHPDTTKYDIRFDTFDFEVEGPTQGSGVVHMELSFETPLVAVRDK